MPKTKKDILDQQIWLNSHIKINDRPIYFINWFKAGIKTLHDIYDKNSKILSLADLNKKYNLNINFLNYHLFIYAIPKTWR